MLKLPKKSAMRFITLSFLLFCVFFTQAQQTTVYNPNADAEAEIAAALKQAKAENKHVFLQIGGNWCSWCLLFNKYAHENDTIKTAFDKNYVVVHVNYSKEQKNEKLLSSLGYPQRFGFPVFVILDAKGNRQHTQNTALLEQGHGYDTKRVLGFLENWSPKALDPASYAEKK